MKNIIKGFITTTVGAVIFLGTLLHWTGYYKFPNPNFLDTDLECFISLLASGCLTVFPETIIEELLIKTIKALINKFFGNGEIQ